MKGKAKCVSSKSGRPSAAAAFGVGTGKSKKLVRDDNTRAPHSRGKRY